MLRLSDIQGVSSGGLPCLTTLNTWAAQLPSSSHGWRVASNNHDMMVLWSSDCQPEVQLRYWPSGSGRAGTRSVGCSPDNLKPMLLISSSHEKQNGYQAEGFSRERVFILWTAMPVTVIPDSDASHRVCLGCTRHSEFRPGRPINLHYHDEGWGGDADRAQFFIAVHRINSLSLSRSPRLYSRLLLVRRNDQQHRFVWAAPDTPSPHPPRAELTFVTITKWEGKAASRPRHANNFPTESHTRASSLGKLSAGIGNPCDRAGSWRLGQPGRTTITSCHSRCLIWTATTL